MRRAFLFIVLLAFAFEVADPSVAFVRNCTWTPTYRAMELARKQAVVKRALVRHPERPALLAGFYDPSLSLKMNARQGTRSHSALPVFDNQPPSRRGLEARLNPPQFDAARGSPLPIYHPPSA